jgi:hypothetical protein
VFGVRRAIHVHGGLRLACILDEGAGAGAVQRAHVRRLLLQVVAWDYRSGSRQRGRFLTSAMSAPKPLVRPILHECPVCHYPQTKIQRRVGTEKLGPTNYVCSRTGECCLGINLTKVENWIAV